MSDQQPLVSVLVAAYNAEQYLAETLESVLCQDYASIELIVVDDASSDGTRGLTNRYRSRGIRVLQHESNRGVSAAVNTGATAASGELIALLDHDDVWLPGKLARQVELFTLAPDLDICFTDYVEFGDVQAEGTAFAQRDEAMRQYPRKEICPEGYLITSDSFLLDMIRIQATPMPSTTVFRSHMLKSALPLDERIAHQDVQLTFRLANRARFGYVDRPLVRRRIHGANWGTQMGTLRWLESHIKTLDQLPNWTALSAEERTNVAWLLGGYLRAAGYTAFQTGAMVDARRYYSRSLRSGFSWKGFLYFAASHLPPTVVATLRSAKRTLEGKT